MLGTKDYRVGALCNLAGFLAKLQGRLDDCVEFHRVAILKGHQRFSADGAVSGLLASHLAGDSRNAEWFRSAVLELIPERPNQKLAAHLAAQEERLTGSCPSVPEIAKRIECILN